ncbi:MAG: FAD-dependent oxidoreductase [Caldilineaceae bacterium SB0666_bin_21]|nr:FAD-dependent oxidoreductase [Caldilineaceae bacterium SB0666_bin_21]
MTSNILIAGAGAFGLSAALALTERGHQVAVVDPTGPTSHSQAASRDISKIVRSEYWSDPAYTELAEAAIDRWREWNDRFGLLYHETGVTLLAPNWEPNSYEAQSLATARKLGKQIQVLDTDEVARRFPMVKEGSLKVGYHNPRGGYAESLKTLRALFQELADQGVDFHVGRMVERPAERGDRCFGFRLTDGGLLEADHMLVCGGAWSGTMVPDVASKTRPTGQPLFHLQVEDPAPYTPPNFPAMMLDIANTGIYVLPQHSTQQVVKVGLHTSGRDLDPMRDDRIVTDTETRIMRHMFGKYIPELAAAPVIDSRICLYCDTPDYHFWIDRHPDIDNLTVACGGSGHGFKFMPVLGAIIADAVEGKTNRYHGKFRWHRPLPNKPYHGERRELADLALA